MLLADFVLHPGSVAAWLVVGLFAGWLAGRVAENPSYGTVGDLVIGAVGAVVGGAVLGFFVAGDPALWATILTSVLGACTLIVVAHAVAARMSA